MFAFRTVLAAAGPHSAPPSSGTDFWTLIPAWIGAAAVLIGWLAFLLTRRQRRRRGEREEQLTNDVAEMGDAIGELTTMVTSLAEEMRGRAPRPQLRFTTKDGPTPAVVVRKPAVPSVDVDAIVERERETVLSKRPPIANARTDESMLPPEMRSAALSVSRLSALFANAGGLGFGNAKYLPVTEDDYAAFDEKVDKYCDEVRAFVGPWLEYLAKRRVSVVFTAQVDNDGGAPAEESRIKIFFPDPCGEAELPERPELPIRPKFLRRLNPMHPSNRGFGGLDIPSLAYRPPHLDIPSINIRRDHSGPHYKKGSLEVAYDYDSLPHHDTVELEPFVVGIAEPGVYAVRWTIGAKNLVRLEEGTLEVEVIHEEANPVAVATLGELVKARNSAS